MRSIEYLKSMATSYANIAIKFLKLDYKLQLIVEDNPNRFKSEQNACELYEGIIYINSQWLMRVGQLEDETEFRTLIYHEIRHVYQLSEINKLEGGLPTSEEPSRIRQWSNETRNVIRNENDEKTIEYFKQSIEIDAIAFSIFLVGKNAKRDKTISMESRGIPDGIDDTLRIRVQEISQKYG